MFYSYGYNSGAITVVLAVTLFIGLIVGIIALFSFLPKKNAGKYDGFTKYLYDFLNFDKYWFISIVKVLFIALATMCLLGGFIVLFINFLTGLGLILSGIIIRITTELTMVLMNIGNNVSQIKDEVTKNQQP